MGSQTTPRIQFDVVRVWTASQQEGCQACGHPINARYVLSDGQGHFLTVGSECAVNLCGAVAKTIKQRRDRAARQWLKQLPALQQKETREQYIDRRVGEMANAMVAHRAWQLFIHHEKWHQHLVKLHYRTESLYRLKRPFPGFPLYGHEFFEPVRVMQHWIKVFEKRYSANGFDFRRKPWDVVKI